MPARVVAKQSTRKRKDTTKPSDPNAHAAPKKYEDQTPSSNKHSTMQCTLLRILLTLSLDLITLLQQEFTKNPQRISRPKNIQPSALNEELAKEGIKLTVPSQQTSSLQANVAQSSHSDRPALAHPQAGPVSLIDWRNLPWGCLSRLLRPLWMVLDVVRDWDWSWSWS
jgi:hypothetical protein